MTGNAAVKAAPPAETEAPHGQNVATAVPPMTAPSVEPESLSKSAVSKIQDTTNVGVSIKVALQKFCLE